MNETYEYDAALFGTSVTEPDPSSYANFLTSSSPSPQWAPRQPRPHVGGDRDQQGVDEVVERHAGDERAVSASLATKVQGHGSRLLPDSAKAALHRRMAEPGSGT